VKTIEITHMRQCLRSATRLAKTSIFFFIIFYSIFVSLEKGSMTVSPSYIPSAELLSNVVVQDTPDFGRTAVAACDMDAGEVVIVERPMLMLRVSNETNLLLAGDEEEEVVENQDVRIVALREAFRNLAVAAGNVPLDMLAVLFSIIANERNTAEVISAVMLDMYSPPTDGPSVAETLLLKLFLSPPHFDACVPSWSPARRWFASASVGEVARLQSCCRINVHADDTRGFSGLFRRCSKFAHSCNANTFWFLHVPEGQSLADGAVAVHIATRRIKQGELLAFSYLGSGLNMVSPTAIRRARLQELSFDCLCDRCFLYDCGRESCRSLQCPDCGKMAMSLVPPSGGWFCLACRESKAYSEGLSASFFRENVLRTASMQLFFAAPRAGGMKPSEAPSDDEVRRAQRCWIAPILAEVRFNGLLVRWTLMELIEQHLGPTHFIFMLGAFAIFRCWIRGIQMLVEAGKNDVEEFLQRRRALGCASEPWERQLLRWYSLGKRWIAANVPGGCLSANFVLLAEEAAFLSTNEVELMTLLEPSEAGSLMRLQAEVSSDAAPLCLLKRWKEFQPLYKRSSESS
jgi:hypothetical protein